LVAALALLDLERYRVVITDLRLSRRDRFEGLEILEHVRQRDPETACVVLTAYGSAENEQRARERGASAFLEKPQPLDQVATVVAALVRSGTRRLRRAPPVVDPSPHV
jgi:two-component system response regulator PilR (NtrC family)